MLSSPQCSNLLEGTVSSDMPLSDRFVGKLSLYRINFGMIILLQKTPDANTIQKYRPICLLQVMYKILTKVITL